MKMITKGNKGLDYYSYLVLIFLLLQIAMPWVCVTSTSRPFALSHHSSAAAAAAYQQPGAGLEQSHDTSEIKNGGVEAKILKGDQSDQVMRMGIGSSPPNCEHKCYGCTPCQPTQVPTTSARARARAGIQYANYEPEGWRCQCGPSFYTP